MNSAILTTKITGHVHIGSRLIGEVDVAYTTELDKFNAVHNKNMAIAIARGLANEPPDIGSGIGKHQIFKIKLGNGGSTIDSMNMITYQPPNVTGASATLYNATYSEIIDESQAGTPSENSVTYQESPAPDETTIVICTATIAAGEPSGQDLSDSPPNPNPEAQFAFDELGLFTYDDKLLTHIIFSPILKTSNRELVITYTLTIAVS
jgi:hypothetical protein